MRKIVKQDILKIIDNLISVNNRLMQLMEQGNVEALQALLSECQSVAINIGNTVELEVDAAVAPLEEYCELLYQIAIGESTDIVCLDKCLAKASEAIAQAKEHLEVVFLPYKASMWDSLESIWRAADRDENCEAYVVPIPYYDKNPDGSFAQMYYEGEMFPEDVPIIAWESYDFDKRRPDVVYIHNPYDEFNYVTSVHPFYYSKNLKQYTETLVYVPYYSTAGGMSEAQRLCSAYLYADYIVTQAEMYRQFFDESISGEKLLPFGSPKFDKVLRKCMNPPVPPQDWAARMEGKKVYFYNTSLNGMLADTRAFLRKMEYVFRCFVGREDACLLWRPHPLLENTFASMRKAYKPVYDRLKLFFLQNQLGIYDDTPDITDTIALCDAYIGDSGTSVTSLFGIAGKPLFILDNHINQAPGEDDWRGQIVKGFSPYEDNRYIVTQGNKLYYAPEGDFKYQFYCNLAEYAYGWYYCKAIPMGNKVYVCPGAAQNILEIAEGKVVRSIEIPLIAQAGQKWSFNSAASYGKYLLLITSKLPAVICYDTEKDELQYFTEYCNQGVEDAAGKWTPGAYCMADGYLWIPSATENRVLELEIETGHMRMFRVGVCAERGWRASYADGQDVWFLSATDIAVVRWNRNTGEVCEYTDMPEGFGCQHPMQGYVCSEQPFGTPAATEEYLYLPPAWGNMYLRLDKRSGKITEWKPALERLAEPKNGYYVSGGQSSFLARREGDADCERLLFSTFDRKLYLVNLNTGQSREIPVVYDKAEVEQQEPGFCMLSENVRYGCQENVFNTLTDFMDGNIIGAQFDRETQIEIFETIIANSDGTCGQQIHEYITQKQITQRE